MTFASTRSSAADRLRQVRSLLTLIRERETEEGIVSTDDTKMLRGLFFVHLYSALEYSVNAAVQEALRTIASKNARTADLETRFHSISLHHLFQSYLDSKGRRIRKRLDILDAQTSVDACVINDSLFAEQLQNVWSDTILDVCDCLCLDLVCLKNKATRIYLDEVVDRRNAVAHGRESAVDVGSRMNAAALDLRLVEVGRVVEELTDSLEQHVDQLGFVRVTARAQYAAPAA